MSEVRKAAAAIVLGGDRGQQVLLCRRNAELRFMPDAWVFPGGRIDDSENCQQVIGADDEHHAAAIHAACREIFEETGLLCVRGELPDHEEVRTARQRTLDEEAFFDEFLLAHDLRIDAADFEPAGVWVTPPFVPIRFDTRYFLCRYTGDREPELIHGEMVDLRWMWPGEVRQQWHRSELKLPHPVAYVLQQMAAEPHPDLMAALRQTTVSHAPKFGRVEFRCGINVLALESSPLGPATHTNCILVGERELYVIDPGAEEEHEFDHLRVQIEHQLALGGRLAAVLLTHSHRDHIGGAEYLRETFGVPVWSHPETNRQLNFDVDGDLHDGQVIEVAGDPGWRLRCLHTPGHDPGHVCFLEERTRTLLAGDMLAQMGTVIIAPQIEGDMQQYLDSLQRLLTEDIHTIIPAHGLPIGKVKQKIQGTIDHRLAREQKIVTALQGGAHTLQQLIAQVYDDVDSSLWPLAEQTLLAHLTRLGHSVEDGQVSIGRL